MKTEIMEREPKQLYGIDEEGDVLAGLDDDGDVFIAPKIRYQDQNDNGDEDDD